MFLPVLCFLPLSPIHLETHKETQKKPVVYQIGSFESLAAGRFDGSQPIRKLLEHGDFGVGTFNGLDGEMVVLDGKIYRANGFGDANVPPLDTKTPFAFVVPFQANILLRLTKPLSTSALQATIDKAVNDPGKILAIRVDGEFSDLTLRSYRRQLKPYHPFAKLKDAQSLFLHSSNAGTFVGFRMPKSVGSSNVPGYHFHFLNRKRTRAGHVLAYRAESGTIEIMFLNGFEMSK